MYREMEGDTDRFKKKKGREKKERERERERADDIYRLQKGPVENWWLQWR